MRLAVEMSLQPQCDPGESTTTAEPMVVDTKVADIAVFAKTLYLYLLNNFTLLKVEGGLKSVPFLQVPSPFFVCKLVSGYFLASC